MSTCPPSNASNANSRNIPERFRALAESSDLRHGRHRRQRPLRLVHQRYLELIDSTLEWKSSTAPGSSISIPTNAHRCAKLAPRRRLADRLRFRTARRQPRRQHPVGRAPRHRSARQTAFRGFVATVEDITARKEAEDALRQSEAKFAPPSTRPSSSSGCSVRTARSSTPTARHSPSPASRRTRSSAGRSWRALGGIPRPNVRSSSTRSRGHETGNSSASKPATRAPTVGTTSSTLP